ncbi:hypothetical protein SH1V18_45590 [Vallitalea longa]|uniref:Uncharacterized protein n=1 Tax=Vallitalea longa TaxID=2936439 RepID=A0A9W5YHL6_9FIRM|nr:hypothetical protein [Vallitalea longa]GKX32079.1 hypothetical protein SH1V18_45590 [Vallitalea longa]
MEVTANGDKKFEKYVGWVDYSYFEETFDNFIIAQQSNLWKWCNDVEIKATYYTEVGVQTIGGISEYTLGTGVVGTFGWTGWGIPISIGGAYIAADGASNVTGGISKIISGFKGEYQGDTMNIMKRLYINISPKYGEEYYNNTQMEIGLISLASQVNSLKKGITYHPRKKNIDYVVKNNIDYHTQVVKVNNKIIITRRVIDETIKNTRILDKTIVDLNTVDVTCSPTKPIKRF